MTAPEQWPLHNDNIFHAVDKPTDCNETDDTPASPSPMPEPSGVRRALFSVPPKQEEDSTEDETNFHGAADRRPCILDKIEHLN